MTRLRYRATLMAPITTCFDLVRDVGVHCATSVSISGRAVGGRLAGRSELGDETRWSARYFGFAWELTTRITKFDRPFSFSDESVQGPFRAFGHLYTFREVGPKETLFEDTFTFASRFGLLGYAVDRLLLAPQLAQALVERGEGIKALASRFGKSEGTCDEISHPAENPAVIGTKWVQGL